MDKTIDTRCEHARIRLIAAAIGFQQCEGAAGTGTHITGTDKRILIGNDEYLAKVVAPARTAPADAMAIAEKWASRQDAETITFQRKYVPDFAAALVEQSSTAGAAKGGNTNDNGSAALATQAAKQPVARLHEEISDRPFSEGKSYFEITILDRKRCFDGMNLYAHPAAPVEPVATPAGWSIERSDDVRFCKAIRVANRNEGFATLRSESDDPRETVLYRYFDQFLAAAPSPAPAVVKDDLITAPAVGMTEQADVSEARELWETALSHAAMYVEHHCVDGEQHANAIMGLARPKFTVGASSSASAARHSDTNEKGASDA